jgi:hypothetical protein
VLWPAALAMLPAHPAAAQREERYLPIENFRIVDRSGEIGFEGYYLSQHEERDGEKLRLSNMTFQQYILYRLRGYSYHPRFLDFRAQVKLGLMEQIIERSGVGDGDNSWTDAVGGYDIFINFFKEHPFSASLFAQRDRRAVIEIFSDQQLIETNRYGLILNWKKRPLPMDLAVSRSEVEQWGIDSRTESALTTLDYSIRHELSRRMRTELRYRYNDYDEDFRADAQLIDIERTTRNKSHDVSLLNTLYLNRERSSYLTSLVRYFDQTGTQDLGNFYWQEQLNLRHGRNLRSYYLFNLLKNEFEDGRTRSYRAEAGLDHQLYQSLTTHLDVHGRRLKFDEAEDRETGMTGRVDYRKRTPWGRLTAGYGRTLDWIERDQGEGVRRVINEGLTLDAVQFVFLDEINVIPDSLVVTDPAGNIFYVEGFDYEVQELGARLGLRPLAGGRLSGGDRVEADYDFIAPGDFDYISDEQNFYVRYSLERWLRGLTLYYRWQDVTGRDAPPDEAALAILELTAWLAGLQYEWRRLLWTLEYEDYNSNFNSYTQWRAQVEGRHRVNNSVRLGWFAGLLAIDYDEIGRGGEDQTDVLFAGINADGRFHRNGFWQVEAQARDEDGLNEETLLGLVGRIGWRWRRLRIESGARIEQRERFESTRDRYQVYFQIAREF